MWISINFILSFYFGLVLSVPDNYGDVVFVSLVFRHGDRTPIEPYPNDPYKNNSLWPTGWGELTNVGKLGHYNLGKWLRQRYDGLLPKTYRKEDIYIRSTDVDRSLMSAYSNLAGLYEPDLKSNWNQNIKWTPIPVHTIPENLDEVLAGKSPCPKYSNEMKKLLDSPKFVQIDEKYKNLYEYIRINTGKNISSVIDVERVYDTLFIEDLNNFTLPNWTKSVYPEPMKSIAEFTFSIPCYTHLMARLKIGPFFKELLQHMNEKISGKMKIDRKAWMYSAHDTTVANVLSGLGLFEPHCPPYLSLILFELRKKDNNYFVAIHYRNSSSNPPYFLQLKGCNQLCPFKDFERLITPLIPSNWKKECQATIFTESIYATTTSFSFVTIVSLTIFLLFIFIIFIRFYKKQADGVAQKVNGLTSVQAKKQ